MERNEAVDDFSSRNNVMQSSVKQEPDSDCALNFQGNEMSVLDYKAVKIEPQDWSQVEIYYSASNIKSENLDDRFSNLKSTEIKIEPQCEHKLKMEDLKNVLVKPEFQDVCHTEMRLGEYNQAINIKLEAGDPEAAGRGVDGGLRGRLKEEETSPDPEGNLNTVPL